MPLAEPRNVIDHAQPSQLSSDNLQNPPAAAILVSHAFQRLQVLAVSILQLNEDSQEQLLVIPVVGKENLGELVQRLNATDPVEAELNLRTTFHVDPTLFDQNRTFHGESPDLGLVKKLR